MLQFILLMQLLILVQGKAFPHDRSHYEDNYGYYGPKEHGYDGYNYHYNSKPKYVLKYVVDGKEIIVPPVPSGHEMHNMYPNPYMPAPIVSDPTFYGSHYPHTDVSHHDYHRASNNPNIYVHHDTDRYQENEPNYYQTSQAVHIRPNVHNYNSASGSSALNYEFKNEKESDYLSDQPNRIQVAEKDYYDDPVVVEALVKQEIPKHKQNGPENKDYEEPLVIEALIKTDTADNKYFDKKSSTNTNKNYVNDKKKSVLLENSPTIHKTKLYYEVKETSTKTIKPTEKTTVVTKSKTPTIRPVTKVAAPHKTVKPTTKMSQKTNQVQTVHPTKSAHNSKKVIQITSTKDTISQPPPKFIEKVSSKEEPKNNPDVDGDDVDEDGDYEPEVIESIILNTSDDSKKNDELDYNDEMMLVTQKPHVKKQNIDHNNDGITGVVIKKEIIIQRKHDDIEDYDYDEPEVSEVLVKVESQKQAIENDYEAPVVVEALVKTNLDKKEHKDADYEEPHVVEKLVKVSTVTSSAEDYEEPQVVETLVKIPPKSNSVDDYEEPQVVETLVKIPPKSNSVDDYEEPQVVEALVKLPPKSNSVDDYEEPQVIETLIKINTESTSNEDYEEPHVVEELVKISPEASSNEDYEEPQVVEALVKISPKTILSEDYEHQQVDVLKHKTQESTANEDYDKSNNGGVFIKSETTTGALLEEQVSQGTQEIETENPKLLKVDSLLITRENEKGERIPIVNAIALKKPNEDKVTEIRVNAENLNDVHIINLKNLKLENDDAFDEEGSGEDVGDVPSLGARNFLPVNPNIFTHVNRIPFQEMQKFKNCSTRNNEPGHCMPLQLCFVQNVAGSVENILNNVCVIDEVFIGICCPEFPTETVQVELNQSEDIQDVSAEIVEAIECGILPKELNEIGVWPWMALLVSRTQDKIFCGGALISSNYVVTAAHCTTRIPGNQIYIRLRSLGSTKVSDEEISVVQIKRHALYNRRTKQNDIALLKLSKHVQFGEFRRPVCLPSIDENLVGKTGIFLGWKRILEKRTVENLQVLPNQSCQQSLGVLVRDSVICAGPRTEEVMCNIDSGSPLILLKEQKYEMIGILTWNRNDCDGRVPSLFTRVPNFTTWIQSHTT